MSPAKWLDEVVQQIRDYLDAVDPDTDHIGWNVTIVPWVVAGIGALYAEVMTVRRVSEDVTTESIQAAVWARTVAGRLREAGSSVTDSAVILQVSRGRVSRFVDSCS